MARNHLWRQQPSWGSRWWTWKIEVRNLLLRMISSLYVQKNKRWDISVLSMQTTETRCYTTQHKTIRFTELVNTRQWDSEFSYQWLIVLGKRVTNLMSWSCLRGEEDDQVTYFLTITPSPQHRTQNKATNKHIRYWTQVIFVLLYSSFPKYIYHYLLSSKCFTHYGLNT